MDTDTVSAKELMPGHKETAMATDYYAGHVGSLLRQPWLLDARARHQRGEPDHSGLREAEDHAGGFEPLRFVRPGTTVVLGLISSKVPVLESQDDLRRRIDEAARYVPLENLAISPQCGFASTAAGNVLTVNQERRKLGLVVDTAQKVWGQPALSGHERPPAARARTEGSRARPR